jgi:hypothetical protein
MRRTAEHAADTQSTKTGTKMRSAHRPDTQRRFRIIRMLDRRAILIGMLTLLFWLFWLSDRSSDRATAYGSTASDEPPIFVKR